MKLLFLSLFIIVISYAKDEDSHNKPTATTAQASPPPTSPCFNIKDGHPLGRALISYSKAAHCPTQHVTIPQNIKVIGPNAFKNVGLKEVFIPSTVTRIEDGAFDSNHLKRVILPDSVSHIGKNAFSNNKLLRINILMNIKSIRPKAFSGNPLSDGICIEFPSHHPSYKRISKNAFPDHVRARVGFICQTETGHNVSGEESSTKKADSCFNIEETSRGRTLVSYSYADHCPTKVKIPKGVKIIGRRAFGGGGYPYKATKSHKPMRGTWKEILDAGKRYSHRFNNLHVRIKVELEGLSLVTDEKRRGKLREVVIPDTVTHIGDYAFHDNYLWSVDFPNSVVHIGKHAFRKNMLDHYLRIPSSVNYIGIGAFELNDGLDRVCIENPQNGGNDNKKKISGRIGGNIKYKNQCEKRKVFPKPPLKHVPLKEAPRSCFKVEHRHPHGRVLTSYSNDANCPRSVKIPEDLRIKVIGPRAFKNKYLIRVKIPNTVTRIEDEAFADNYLRHDPTPRSVYHIGNKAFSRNRIIEVWIPDNITYVGRYAFDGNPRPLKDADELRPSKVLDICVGKIKNGQKRKIEKDAFSGARVSKHSCVLTD